MDLPNARILEFVDNGYTGTNVERPAFQEMIELVRCGRVNCIIVKDFSRFARNAPESGYYIEKVFPLYRVRFIAVGNRFDSSDYKDGTGGIDVAFKFLMNEYYSKDLSTKIKSSLHTLMKNGEHIVGNAIYGYRKNNGKWEQDPSAVKVIREIFNMALDGKTTAQIREKLITDKQLAPREYEYFNKGKEIIPKFNWTTKQIWRILTNEQYTGTYIAGKQETSRIDKVWIEKDRSEWIVIPNSHPPIISKAKFERIGEILKSPKTTLDNGRKRSNHAKKLYDRIESGDRKPAAAPFGYLINESKEFEIDDSAAVAVKMIYDLALQGYTVRDIAEKLQEERYLPPGEYFKIIKGTNIQPTYRWATLRVREILKERQYTGTYVAGRTFQDENGGKYHTPESEWIIIPDKHPAIVSKEVFEQMQELFSQGKRKMQPHNYLLKGKIVCGTLQLFSGNKTSREQTKKYYEDKKLVEKFNRESEILRFKMNKLVFELNTIEAENEEQMTEQIMWLLRNSSKIEYYSDMIFPGIGTEIENIQYKPLAEKLVREAETEYYDNNRQGKTDS
jgi:DNA invertase Pin-like site-specific DNA recombinase